MKTCSVTSERAARAPRRHQVPDRRAARPERIDAHQAYSIVETASALDISRQGVYNLINDGRLATVKLDSRPRIPGSEIIKLLTPVA